MGFINLAVAFNFSTDTWVNFKLFGGMGLMLIFTVGQGIYMSRYIQPETADGAPAKAAKKAP